VTEQVVDVPYCPHPGQRKVHDSQARFRVMACGARWGKDRCTVNELIRQVVTNLLGNARRFSRDDAPIEIVVGADRMRAIGTIAIVDHGEGIPPQIRDQIFQRFWRADTSRARETGGSGLGLAIVASIVSALDGSVAVEETPGGGATFIVSLPLATVAGTPEHLMALTQPIERLDP